MIVSAFITVLKRWAMIIIVFPCSPVIAYNTKGPKDIIRNGLDGYLVNTGAEIIEKINKFLHNDDKITMKQSAIKR